MQHPEPYYVTAVTKADLPLLAQWLAGPHLRPYWGTAPDELAHMRNNLTNPLISQYIVSRSATPIAYLQSYLCHSFNAPQYHDQPDTARAVDLFIGPPDALNHGHGSALLRHYAQRQKTCGTPALLIDPDPSNERAVRSYRRAGFIEIGLRQDAEANPVLVMSLPTAPFICS